MLEPGFCGFLSELAIHLETWRQSCLWKLSEFHFCYDLMTFRGLNYGAQDVRASATLQLIGFLDWEVDYG